MEARAQELVPLQKRTSMGAGDWMQVMEGDVATTSVLCVPMDRVSAGWGPSVACTVAVLAQMTASPSKLTRRE